MTRPRIDRPTPAAPPQGRDSGFARTYSLGHWAGVAVSAHWSVLLTIALFADLLATSALPAERPGHVPAAYWATGVVAAAVLIVTLLAHELAHALVARHFGMRVRKITLWMLGGLTELDGDPPKPGADALIAVAGPLTSLAFGGVSAALAWWVGTSGLIGAALSWLATVSIVLAVFNLLPGAPFDGGRLVRAVLWWHYKDRARAAAGAAQAGRVMGMSFVVLGLLEVLAGAFTGLWLAMIGWFVITGAAGEADASRTERLRGMHARDVMSPAPMVGGEWWTVEQFLARLSPDAAPQPVFPVVDFEGHAVGALTLHDLQRIPAARRDTMQLRHVIALRRVRPLIVTGDAELTGFVTPLRMHGGVALVVDDGQRPLGVITQAELERAAQFAELGRPRTPAQPPPTGGQTAV
jgi:Zn-dependent protease/CBS domain-containing protein